MSVSLKEITELLSIDIVKAVLTNNMFLVPVTLVDLISVIAFYDLMNRNAFKKKKSQQKKPLIIDQVTIRSKS